MKMNTIYRILFFCLLLCTSNIASSQPPSFDNDTSDVPIDGGLSILLAFGVGYGIKKNMNQDQNIKK